MAPLVDIPHSGQFAPGPDFVKNAPLSMWPTLTPEEQQLSGEFCLVQMLRTGTTTVVDAHGNGAIWWPGNPPTDKVALAQTVGRIGCQACLGLGFRSDRSHRDRAGRSLLRWDEEMGAAGLLRCYRLFEQFRRHSEDPPLPGFPTDWSNRPTDSLAHSSLSAT